MHLITAYHDSGIPGLFEIQPSKCNSPMYDGYLCKWGWSLACFNTTRFNGALSTITQFPRRFVQNASSHRYTMQFDPGDFYKFLVVNVVGRKVGFLLLSRRIECETRLAEKVRQYIPEFESAQAWEYYFPNGEANDYSTHHAYRNAHKGKMFVSVYFCQYMRVDYAGIVRKSDSTKRSPDDI